MFQRRCKISAAKSYIKHVHVKDTKIVNGEFKLSLVGQGDLPIAGAVDLLKRMGIMGGYHWSGKKMASGMGSKSHCLHLSYITPLLQD